MPVWSILVFPTLFTAGVSLIDTTDSVLILGAYGWAFVNPVRKLHYNLTITFISVVIEGIEALGLLADKLEPKGAFWGAIGTLPDNFGILGYLITGIFVLSWPASAAIYKWCLCRLIRQAACALLAGTCPSRSSDAFLPCRSCS